MGWICGRPPRQDHRCSPVGCSWGSETLFSFPDSPFSSTTSKSFVEKNRSVPYYYSHCDFLGSRILRPHSLPEGTDLSCSGLGMVLVSLPLGFQDCSGTPAQPSRVECPGRNSHLQTGKLWRPQQTWTLFVQDCHLNRFPGFDFRKTVSNLTSLFCF